MNAFGTQLRDPINLELTRLQLTVYVCGRRRGKRNISCLWKMSGLTRGGRSKLSREIEIVGAIRSEREHEYLVFIVPLTPSSIGNYMVRPYYSLKLVGHVLYIGGKIHFRTTIIKCTYT